MDYEDVDQLISLMQPSMAIAPELPLASPGALQDELLDDADRVRHLAASIAKLTERLQLVLSLHYVEGLTYKEIAQALEVSEARVCQIHGEAVKKLRVILEDVGVEAA
jgi:RNA polymerase sigma factor for flagellar operon FliA